MRSLRTSWSTVLVWAAAAVAVFGLSGCSSTHAARDGSASTAPASSAPIAVVASTDVYGDIAATIGAAAVSVTSIIDRPDVDPHTYQADARTRLALQRADVVIENGGGYDDFVDTLRRADGSSDAAVLNAVAISGYDAAPEGDLNEHVWYDLPTMRSLATKLAAEFGRLDPAHASEFVQRARAFESGLSRLARIEAALADRYGGTKVAITEPVPLYLLSACGLVNVTPPGFSEAVEEGIDVAPRVLARTLHLFDSGHPVVSVLVQNGQTDDAATRRVHQAAVEARVPIVAVTETLPAGIGYLAWMRDNLRALREALAS